MPLMYLCLCWHVVYVIVPENWHCMTFGFYLKHGSKPDVDMQKIYGERIFAIYHLFSLRWMAKQMVSSKSTYRKTSYISRTLVGNKLVDNSDVVGHRLSALLQLHLHSQHTTWLQWIERRQLYEDTIKILGSGFGATYTRGFTVIQFPLRPITSAP